MNESVLDVHDAVLLDLDGTVYRGGELIPRAQQSIHAMHDRGCAVRYVTNNASKPARDVAERLTGLGLPARADEVATSAEAGAALLAQQLPAGANVLVVGSSALAGELEHVGLTPVRNVADTPVAVVQGHSPDTAWPQLAEACLALRAGAIWVACNEDLTLPSERGELPGNGAMVAALRAATGREPEVAGKPQRPLLDRATKSARASTPIMVGDRMDTDIAGARNCGMASLLVLTGVDQPASLLAAPPEARPRYVGNDLGALFVPPADVEIREQDGWNVVERGSALELAATSDSEDPLAALRALCAAWWQRGSGSVELRAADRRSAAALSALDLG